MYKKKYDVFPYMNKHYFQFINQTLSLKLKEQFTEISFQKEVVCIFLRIIDFLMNFNKLFHSKKTNHKN